MRALTRDIRANIARQKGVQKKDEKMPAHKATYAADKRKGGYLIRVEGPTPDRFAGREVPVTRRDGSSETERLDRLIWTGKDSESGKPVSLYTFVAKPRDAEKQAEF
jgi:hypothetical protein